MHFTYVHVEVHTGIIQQIVNKHSRLHSKITSILETAFSQHCYLNQTTLKQLAEKSGIKEQKITNWFKKKREKMRHGTQEATQPIGEHMHVYISKARNEHCTKN